MKNQKTRKDSALPHPNVVTETGSIPFRLALEITEETIIVVGDLLKKDPTLTEYNLVSLYSTRAIMAALRKEEPPL